MDIHKSKCTETNMVELFCEIILIKKLMLLHSCLNIAHFFQNLLNAARCYPKSTCFLRLS